MLHLQGKEGSWYDPVKLWHVDVTVICAVVYMY